MWYVILNRITLQYFITQYPDRFRDSLKFFIYETVMTEVEAYSFANHLNTLESSWEQ